MYRSRCLSLAVLGWLYLYVVCWWRATEMFWFFFLSYDIWFFLALSGRSFSHWYPSHVAVTIILFSCMAVYAFNVISGLSTKLHFVLSFFFVRLLSFIQFLHRPFWYTFDISTGCVAKLSDLQKSRPNRLFLRVGINIWIQMATVESVDFFLCAEICAAFANAVRIVKYFWWSERKSSDTVHRIASKRKRNLR